MTSKQRERAEALRIRNIVNDHINGYHFHDRPRWATICPVCAWLKEREHGPQAS